MSKRRRLAGRVGQRSNHLAWARLGELIENAGACVPWMQDTLLAFMRCISASVFFGIRCSLARNVNTAS